MAHHFADPIATLKAELDYIQDQLEDGQYDDSDGTLSHLIVTYQAAIALLASS